MSLEDAINRNSELLEKHIEISERMLAIATGKAASAGAAPAADNVKATRTKKADAAGDAAAAGTAAAAPAAGAATTVSIPDQIAAIKPKIAAWLNEFPDPDPEHEARGEKLTKALASLGVEKTTQITTQDAVDRLSKWIDKQVAAGRITPVPAAAAPATAVDDGEI